MSLRFRSNRPHASSPAARISRPRPAALLGILVVAAALGLALAAAPAAAQPATGSQMSSLSERIRTSSDPGALRNEIDAFLDYHVARLFSDDTAAVSQSRTVLSEQVSAVSDSSAFKSLYAELLAQRLSGRRLSTAPEFNQLNAAIVIERVAQLTRSLRFGPAIAQLIEDDNASVAIWAAKAAYTVFPELLQQSNGRERERLIKGLVDSVKRFPDNGPLAEEVHRTLSMRTIELRPPAAQLLAANAPAVVPGVQDVIAFRVGRYTPSRPAPDPMAEAPGLVVLTNNAVWPAQDEQQKLRTVAVLRDLMLQATATANNLPQQATERRSVVDLIKRTGSAFEGISGPLQPNGPPVQPEVYAAARRVTQLGAVPGAAVMSAAVEGLAQAVQQAYPSLPPPQLSQRQDEPEPATEPTTQPE